MRAEMTISVSKKFSQGVIYSAITGNLYCELTEVYQLLDYMEGYSHYTHELPLAFDRVAPRLAEQFPSLAELVLPFDDPNRNVDWFLSLPSLEVYPVENVPQPN